MIADEKKTASLILDRMSSPPPAGDDEADEPDAGLESAADDLIVAIKGGDLASAARAMRAAFQMLQSEPEEALDG